MYAGFGISFLQYFIFLPVKIIHGKYTLVVIDVRDNIKSLFRFKHTVWIQLQKTLYIPKFFNTDFAGNVGSRIYMYWYFFFSSFKPTIYISEIETTLKTGICIIFFFYKYHWNHWSIKYNWSESGISMNFIL